MGVAPLPINEEGRIETLKSFEILDSISEEEYDNITFLASQICNTPISLITFIDTDRQWFKSHHGITVKESPRNISLCAHTILNPNEPLIVKNAYQDDRFKDNPMVTGGKKFGFYAGIPLVSEEGHALGTLCIIDTKPREISNDQITSLKILSNYVVKLLNLRRANKRLKISEKRLLRVNKNLDDFAHMLSHDLKTPLRHINLYSDILKQELDKLLDSKNAELLDSISQSSEKAMSLVTSVLHYSAAVHHTDFEIREINLDNLIKEICKKCEIPQNFMLTACIEQNFIYGSSTVLTQILTNLITNSIIYNDKASGDIKVTMTTKEDEYVFEIEDNGIGIAPENLGNVFDLFYTIENKSLDHLERSGIGLNIVKKLIETNGGDLEISSEVGKGTWIKFTLMK
jgi:hypothetical protein